MDHAEEMTTYRQETATIEEEIQGPTAVGNVTGVVFASKEAEGAVERTMHGNLVYDMVENESFEELLPDPDVYEAARRIDEERWFYRFVKRSFDILFSGVVFIAF
ncbi:MAG: hypothetical protein RR934_03575, partial [Gordonibacter sp.]|uniref:hypothetical protein n=1 Tax=Gordonibacter sp. TaxID=1968902 RepID=UPI003220262A